MRLTTGCAAMLGILQLASAMNYIHAQEKQSVRECGTMLVLERAFESDPLLRAQFKKQTLEFKEAVNKRKAAVNLFRMQQEVIYVPIVFHVVLPNPAVVTDEQILAQLDVLNKDFAGMNSDSANIPTGFKPLFGKSLIQFKLAQRTPDDEPTTGIVRTPTATPIYSTFDKSLKYSSLGGADAWDNNRFFNVWITNLAGGFILGYATFPGTSPPAEDGVVIHYTTLPADSLTAFNRGRTLTHETGHYFYLYHTWGDENGCTGTDDVDDTPNQTAPTSGCPGGEVTDACTPIAPGILYEDYMDYTEDACMCIFTQGQVFRMETALNDYRAAYHFSNGADPVHLFSLDAALSKINTPDQRVCSSTFSPVIILRNRGIEKLLSADLYTSIDEGPATLTHWAGSLSTLDETRVTLSSVTAIEGIHKIKIIVSSPNGATDEHTANDTITATFQYDVAVSAPLTQEFESNAFPPASWDIVNPDHGATWERSTDAAKTGHASVVIRNFNYQLNNQKDYLRLPLVNLVNCDSAFLTFQLAAAIRTNPDVGIPRDTLHVLVSTDCGTTYTGLYKKSGKSLITRSVATPSSFVPAAFEWRKDSVDLTRYINAGPILITFMNTTEYENNIYLDDINIYSVNFKNKLKEKGLIVTPNPFTSIVSVQFYPSIGTLKSIAIFNSSGQKITEQQARGTTSYNFNLNRFASGVYVVQAIFADKKLTQKVIKR